MSAEYECTNEQDCEKQKIPCGVNKTEPPFCFDGICHCRAVRAKCASDKDCAKKIGCIDATPVCYDGTCLCKDH